MDPSLGEADLRCVVEDLSCGVMDLSQQGADLNEKVTDLEKNHRDATDSEDLQALKTVLEEGPTIESEGYSLCEP